MRRLLVSFLIFIHAVVASAANYDNIIVRHYSEVEGLPNNIVNSVIKTKDGFLWFGTMYGLCRYDGRHFQTFHGNPTPHSDLPPRKIETMVEDGNGNIWVKTLDWRLTVFFKQEGRFKNIYEEIKRYSKNLQVIKIESDGHGHVFLLTKDKTLLLGCTNAQGNLRITKLADAHEVTDKNTLQLKDNVVDIRGNRISWVGKDYSIFTIIRRKSHPRYMDSKSYWRDYFGQKAQQIHTYHDRYGNNWTINNDHIHVVNSRTRQQRTIALTSLDHITTPAFYDGGNKGIFLLAASGDAYIVNPHSYEAQRIALLPQMKDDTHNSRYMSMLLDNEGILWLTTAKSGVYSLYSPPKKFQLFSLFNPTENNGIRSICQMPNGDIWAGTRGKDLYILDAKGNVKQILSYAQYGIGSVYHIMPDSRGRIWLSTKGNGLVLAVKDASAPAGYRFTHYFHKNTDPHSISGNDVYYTYEDSRHRLWVATMDGGLNLLRETAHGVSFINKFNGMSHYPAFGQYMGVRNIVEAPDGRLWIGTIDGLMTLDTRMNKADGLRFSTFRNGTSNYQTNSDINTLFKDRRGRIWMSTFSGGLCQLLGYDKTKGEASLTAVGKRDDLQNDLIIAICEDRKGVLWMITSHELVSYNNTTGHSSKYGRTDGLPLVTFEEGTALAAHDGSVWLGCKKGLLRFFPAKFPDENHHFPLYIIGGTVNNKDIQEWNNRCSPQGSITYAKEIVLRHSENMFTLEYACLNYVKSSSVIYRHRLEGYDKDWHYDGRNTIAAYTNVPPGEYTFVVEGSNSNSPTPTGVAKLQITILPPWWATWWAYTLYAIVIIMVVYFVLRYARYQIRLKNDLYVQTKVAEFKQQFTLEQEDKQFLERVKKIIEENLTNNDFDIEEIARQLGMSRSAFFKKLKATTDNSPSEFVKNYKLAKAVDLLQHSNISVTDVAFACGFTDVSYFGKCFRKKYGMSPKEYRQARSTSAD